MINASIALENVKHYLNSSDGQTQFSYDIVVLEEETMEFELGWVFFYQTKEFVETGDILSALGGNAPIIINKYDGSMHFTGTAYPVEKYIVDYIKEYKKD